MDSVHLMEVTAENLYEVCHLSDTLTPAQQICVASNAYSIAEASFYPNVTWYRAVYTGDTTIGFFLLRFNRDRREALLGRFMIARPYQRRGYGNQILDLIVRKCRDEDVKILHTSVDMGEASPYGFYVGYGFQDTGEHIPCGERVLRLELDGKGMKGTKGPLPEAGLGCSIEGRC